MVPPSPSSSAPKGPRGHRSPRPSPRLGTRWHSQAFEKKVTEQGAPQRQVVQSVEHVHIRLWYSTDLMFS